jgi:WD40-like Beta Propeller Repeat
LHQSPRALSSLLTLLALAVIPWRFASAQQAQKQSPPAQTNKPSAAAPAAPSPVPQSTHFPILLLLQGADQSWDLRIGQKGPERLDRNGYPPIPLEAGEVTREGTGNTWTYHAKDMQTGASVSAHITREPCTGAPVTDPAKEKWVFSASVEHSQIGILQGCARIATELFPRIKNQLTPDDDEEQDARPKTPPPTITKFKSPVFFAYINGPDRMVVKRGALVKAVPGKAGEGLSLSHDGRKLLFTRGEASAQRSISEYDLTSSQTKELVQSNAYDPFWSPDDSQIAFIENTNGKPQLWLMAADAPDKAAAVYQSEVTILNGWADAHTVLTSDLQTLSWIGIDGSVKQTVSAADLYGKDQFRVSSASTIRIHPLNADLLLVSAEVAGPLQAPVTVNDIPSASPDAAKPPKKDEGHPAQALFLYEVRSKRRVLLSPLNLTAAQPEWSADGLQVFFTGRGSPSAPPAIYRIFWDGTGLTKVRDGSGMVIGE